LGFEILVILHESGGWPAEAPNGGDTDIATRTKSKEKVNNKAAAHVGGMRLMCCYCSRQGYGGVLQPLVQLNLQQG
jgi:hypothetical protein